MRNEKHKTRINYVHRINISYKSDKNHTKLKKKVNYFN